MLTAKDSYEIWVRSDPRFIEPTDHSHPLWCDTCDLFDAEDWCPCCANQEEVDA